MKLNVKSDSFKQHTNVLDINIPAHLRVRIKSGIGFMDSVFDGFVPSTACMFTGDPGVGKSTLVRLLGDSLTGQGCSVLMNSGEESPEQIALSCERLRLKHGFTVGQETDVKKLLEYADAVKAHAPTKQLVILQDSLPTLDDGYYADGGKTQGTVIRCCEQLVDYAKKTHAIVLFINQVTKSGQFMGSNKVKHAVDAHLTFEFDRDKKSDFFGERFFSINKNRWGTSGGNSYVCMDAHGMKAMAS